jgi:acyl-CoA thioester hydrolase
VLDGYAFRFPIEVRFRDLDALGHVNNAVYLTYLESARIAYWLELTGRDSLKAMDMILARLEIDYRSPVAYREKLVVGARVGSIGRSSFTMEMRIEEETTGRLVAESKNVLVHYDYASGKSTPIPEQLRRKIAG